MFDVQSRKPAAKGKDHAVTLDLCGTFQTNA